MTSSIVDGVYGGVKAVDEYGEHMGEFGEGDNSLWLRNDKAFLTNMN